MQHIALIKILEICAQSLIKENSVDLIKSKLVLLPNELNQGYLIEGIYVVNGASKVSQKLDKSKLPASCSIE